MTTSDTSAPELGSEKLSEKPVAFKVPDGDLEDLDVVVAFDRAQGYPSTRSSIMRVALRLHLNDRLKRIRS